MEAEPGLAATAGPGASPDTRFEVQHARVLHPPKKGRMRRDDVPVGVPDRGLFDSESTASQPDRNGAMPRTWPLLPDVLWPVTEKPTRRAHTEGTKEKAHQVVG
ncbi:hypothetical protein [Paraburkholderia terrae]